MKKFVCLAMVCLFVLGCTPEAEETGVVARVNGHPIYLDQLKAKYNLQQPDWAGVVPTTVSTLKHDYGKALSDLIVQELVYQALERHGLSVTDEEVQQAEELVRADYPEGAFEQQLVEEYIDIAVWRDQLRARLALDKLLGEIIRPQVKISYKEAEEYLKNQTFALPERVRFLRLRGPGKEVLETAARQYLVDESLDALAAQFDDLSAREQKVRVDQLPDDWRSTLELLAPGQAGPAVLGDDGFEMLVLLERMPAKTLEPSQAYPFVEKVLLEHKMNAAFNAWYEKELAAATVTVSTHLLPDDGDEAVADAPVAEPAQEPEPQFDVEQANGTAG